MVALYNYQGQNAQGLESCSDYGTCLIDLINAMSMVVSPPPHGDFWDNHDTGIETANTSTFWCNIDISMCQM
jgi:hypothetical protein